MAVTDTQNERLYITDLQSLTTELQYYINECVFDTYDSNKPRIDELGNSVCDLVVYWIASQLNNNVKINIPDHWVNSVANSSLSDLELLPAYLHDTFKEHSIHDTLRYTNLQVTSIRVNAQSLYITGYDITC